MIEVQHLTKLYSNHLAVDDLSFTVEKGEIYGLLGPNGAGKSTTMNIITGYISATSGTVKIDGYDIFENPIEARTRIGYLPEQPPLYMDMTPREYLYFIAELKDFKEDDFKTLVERVMGKTGIIEVQNRLIRNLSKGYKQRVGLAGALLGEPEVLILDEPTVGLDPKQIIEIRSLIKSLANEHTVVLSSHILSEISAVCDKVLIMSHGKLVAFDTAENLSHSTSENVVTVSALCQKDALETALANAENLKAIEIIPSSEEGATSARLVFETMDDMRAKVSQIMLENNLPLLSLQVETKTLEDVFLSLTGENLMEELTQDEEYENTAEGKKGGLFSFFKRNKKEKPQQETPIELDSEKQEKEGQSNGSDL